MASNGDLSYMKLHFAEAVPRDFVCCMCQDLMANPSTTSCCKNYFCYECINRIKEVKRPCPKCRKENFSIQQDRQKKDKIESLKLFCPMSTKKGGCRWVGSLRELDAHLSLKNVEGECKYVQVKCPLKCGMHILRGDVEMHKSVTCTQRQFECIYCGFQDLYEKITLEHYHECLEHPVECPNQCQMPGIRRHQLEDHLSLDCPLQAIACEFQHAGCDAKFIHKDQAKHLKDEMQKHLSLVSLKCKKLEESKAELEQKCSRIEGVCVTLQRDILRISADITELNVEVKRNAIRSRLASDPTIDGQTKMS